MVAVRTPEELGNVIQAAVGGLSPRVMQELRRMGKGWDKDRQPLSAVNAVLP